MSSDVAELDRGTGMLPDGWIEVRLGDVSRSFAGGTPSRSNPAYYGSGTPWLKSGEVRAGRISVIEEEITDVGLRESSARVAKAGSPVIAMYGATAGVAGILEIDAALNQAVLAIEPVAAKLDREYCFHMLSAEAPRLLTMTQGSGQPNLSKGLIDGLQVALPPLDEQRRIAEVLRSVDEAVAAAESAVMQAEQALNLNAEKLLVHDLADHANECRLVDLIASLDAGVSVNSEGRPAADGEVGILKTSCVSAGHFDPNENKVVRHDEVGRTRVQPSANSIIISRMNTLDLVGANAFVAEDCPNLYLPDRLWLLKTNSGVICRWLAYYMKTARFRAQIIDIASGTSGSMKNISKGRLADLVLHVPEYAEQEIAVGVLLAMESAMLSGRAILRSYRAMRQSLLSDLLSGHVRVPA
ncbi:MAG: restriction endonuclease subunit S [Sphingobium sp.]